MKGKKSYYVLAGIVAFIVSFSLAFFLIGPDRIVSLVGVENTYLIIFIISAVAGLSTFTGAAVITSIATFAAGGANPLLLALAGGTGIFLSDSLFYFLILYGRKAIPEEWDNKLERIRKWLDRHPSRVVLALTYIYISFTPFPNDLLMIGLVIGGYTYKKVAWVFLAGDLTTAAVIAYLGNVILN